MPNFFVVKKGSNTRASGSVHARAIVADGDLRIGAGLQLRSAARTAFEDLGVTTRSAARLRSALRRAR